MEKTISISDLRTNLADITDLVASGKHTYVLVKNGKPVAKLLPASARADLSPAFAELVDGVFKEYQSDLKKLADTP